MKTKQESKLAVAIPSLYTLAVILYLYEKEDFMIKKTRKYDIFSYYPKYIEVFRKSGRHLYTSLRRNQCFLSKGMKQSNRI